MKALKGILVYTALVLVSIVFIFALGVGFLYLSKNSTLFGYYFRNVSFEDKVHYKNATALCFRVQLVSAQSVQVVALGKGWQLAEQSLLSNGMKPNVGWQDIVLPYDVYNDYELLNGLFYYLSSSGAFTLYIDEITVVTQ